MRVYIDGELRFEAETFRERVTLDFGERFEARTIRVEVDHAEGSLHAEVVTAALKIDFEETSRMILVPTVVKDRRDRPLKDLPLDVFRVKENGRPVPVRSLERRDLPLDLVLMLDTSSSLREGINDLKRAAKAFIGELEPTDRVALFEIKGDIQKLAAFTNNRPLMQQAIDTLFSRGETALFNGLRTGIEALSERQRGRRAMILFTDGRDSIYESPTIKASFMRKVIRQAQNKEITIYTLGLGDKIHEPSLERIAEETGGRFLHAEKALRLDDAFAEIVSDLKNQYVLGVEPRATRPGYHRLEVEVKKRGAKVYARKGYTLE